MKALKTVGDAVQRLKDREDLRRTLIHRANHIGALPSQAKHRERVARDLKDVEADIRDLKRRELAVA